MPPHGPGIAVMETSMFRPRIFARPPVLALSACVVLLCTTGMPMAHATDAAVPPPYTIKDHDKVDMNTYKGYLYYGDQCMRCHGPDGAGSSYAPNLTQSLKVMSKEDVENTIINGRKEVNQASDKVMPAFGTNEDVVENIDNIYNYLLARSTGALGRGHPEHLKQ
jgi:mono/diheme cytochrome c family protein